MKKNSKTTISLFTAGAITTMSISLVLVLLGLTILIGISSKKISTLLKESMVTLTVEVDGSTTAAEISNIRASLEKNKYIRSVDYIDNAEVKERLIEELGADPEEFLGTYYPALSFFDIYLKSEYVNKEGIEAVKKSLADLNLLNVGGFSDELINNANRQLSIVATVLFVLTFILVLISFTLIRSIIQLNIYSKRFIINTMRLVGATNAFIRRPFLWRMVFSGILAAIIASVIVTLIVYYISTVVRITEINMIVTKNVLIATYVSLIVSGIIICAFATVSAINRYLRMDSNMMYKI